VTRQWLYTYDVASARWACFTDDGTKVWVITDEELARLPRHQLPGALSVPAGTLMCGEEPTMATDEDAARRILGTALNSAVPGEPVTVDLHTGARAHLCPVCPGCDEGSHTCPGCGSVQYHVEAQLAAARADPATDNRVALMAVPPSWAADLLTPSEGEGPVTYTLTGPAGPTGWLAEELARQAGAEPLDQALRALRHVAEALGIFRQTHQARSITEVGDMLVQEIARRATQASPAAGQATWAPIPPPGFRVAPGAIAVTVDDDNPGQVAGRFTTNVFEALVNEWRRDADRLRETAGTLAPSDARIGMYNARAFGLDAAANQLADVIEPLRTQEAPHA